MQVMTRFVELTPGKFAHASGALWLAEARAVLLADVHLGYAWAQRRRGQLGPVLDGGVREQLSQVLEELQPWQIVFLGDLVHAPKPDAEERAMICTMLDELRARAPLTLVRGNHDRGFARDFAGCDVDVVEEWTCGDLIARHGDREAQAPVDGFLAVGHHHPAYGLRDAAGVKQKLPVFLVGRRTFVLPAFSPFAAGVDVTKGLTTELKQLFGREPVQGVVATGRRAVAIGRVA